MGRNLWRESDLHVIDIGASVDANSVEADMRKDKENYSRQTV
jgi:hypothetical protein